MSNIISLMKHPKYNRSKLCFDSPVIKWTEQVKLQQYKIWQVTKIAIVK